MQTLDRDLWGTLEKQMLSSLNELRNIKDDLDRMTSKQNAVDDELENVKHGLSNHFRELKRIIIDNSLGE